MKSFKLLPIVMFSGVVLAETSPAVDTKATATSAEQTQAMQTTTNVAQDNVLPQLSFEAQQARAAELMKQADYALQQEQIRQEQAQKLQAAESKVKQTIGNNSLLLSQATAKVYLDNNFSAMWSNPQAEKIFLKEYVTFAVSGVSAKSARALQQILAQPNGLARDMLLTDAFLDYMYYSKNMGRNANQWLYNLGSYSPKTPSLDLIASWENAVVKGSSAQYVANFVPKNHIYQETVQKLLSMLPNSTVGNAKKVKSKKTGSTEQTQAAIVGNSSFYKLALNAQRLRLVPDFTNGIFVNIPSYQLYYFRDGNLALQSKVIVGRDERRTPVMYSKLSNVVVNPPWNVPSTILIKDVVPKLARDPGYADRAGFEIFDGNGNKISARSVNWGSYVNSTSVPFRIRQKAGDDSALGRFKFNMPSSDAIYLHDTPNHALFNKTDRALSSGCVRVAKSDELATILLKEAGWSVERKQSVLASDKTTSVQIRSNNPVYIYYVTSWVEGGKVHSLPDIYKYDVNIPKANLNWTAVRNAI